MFARYIINIHVATVPLIALAFAGSLLAEDKRIKGDLTVSGDSTLRGTLDVTKGVTILGDTDLMGNIFSIGHGLYGNGKPNYGQSGLEIYVKNIDTVKRLIEQVTPLPETTFKWGTREALDTDHNGILDDFGAQWMSLNHEELNVQGNLLVKGTNNQLTAQTITGTNSILTKGLADGLYLTRTAAGTLYLSKQTADATYLSRVSPKLVLGTDSIATGEGSIAFGTEAQASYESIPEGFEDTAAAATAIGHSAYAEGYGATALGSHTWASGINALSLGSFAGAGGEHSMSVGVYAYSGGRSSIALGGSSASGDYSVSVGTGNSVREENGVVIGRESKSVAPDQMVLGAFNQFPESSNGNARQPEDDLFVFANGTSEGQRSNAFVIKRNGDAQLNGSFSVEGVIRIKQPAGGITMGEFVNP